MNWITKKNVQQAAKDGEMAALKCSLEHHHQGATCTRGELIDAIESHAFGSGNQWCACCEMTNSNCNMCPLSDTKPGDNYHPAVDCCGGSYKLWSGKASTAFEANNSPDNFTAFQAAERKVCNYIQAVIDKKTEPEVTYSIGDRFLYRGRRKFILARSLHKTYSVAMVELSDGINFNHFTPVANPERISQQRMEQIIDSGFSDFTRYWDNAKKQYVGPRAEKEPKQGKVELRHGDYGLTIAKKGIRRFPQLAFKPSMSHDEPIRIAHKDGSGGWQNADGNDKVEWLGNIFDDIAAKGKTLDRFEMVQKQMPTITVSVYDECDCVRIGDTSGWVTVQLDQFDEFILKLTQVSNGIKAKNNE